MRDQTTSLSNPHEPIVLSDVRSGTNSAIDFFELVVQLLANGSLVAGDIFICDNASIHKAEEISEALSDVLSSNGVRLVFLPTYSPELKPCELVFAQVKSYLRRNRSDGPFWQDIIKAFSEVTQDNVRGYYSHCIDIID